MYARLSNTSLYFFIARHVSSSSLPNTGNISIHNVSIYLIIKFIVIPSNLSGKNFGHHGKIVISKNLFDIHPIGELQIYKSMFFVIEL